MKRCILYLFIFFFMGTMNPIIAQDSNFTVGLTGGVNKSTYTCKCTIETGTIDQFVYSYSTGVTSSYEISKFFSVTTEITYDRRGTYRSHNRNRFNPEYEGQTWRYFNFLTVPLLLEIKYLPLYIELGASTMFYLSNDVKAKGDNPFVREVEYEPMYYELVGGAGLQFPIMDRFILKIHARAHKGTEDIRYLYRLKTYSLNLGISYKIP